jgi:orotidine-5'-phosphate decarboxylase
MIRLVPAVDLLFKAAADKGHVCAGLDTSIDYVPPSEIRKAQNNAQAVLSYNKALIDAVFDITACFKVQIAYYEEMGIEGLSVYAQTLKYIREKGCLSIADIKRGDIADTALRYVKAHFSGDFQADFVTINPYMGMDSVEPWLKEAQLTGKGAFVLMKTSNPGMKDFQQLEVRDGQSENIKMVYHAVGDKMASLAQKYKGDHGYGMFGAVVSCTGREEAAQIRKNYPNLFFLIPGYGFQGGGAQDAALLLQNGNGGVVNASRSIITAWQKTTGKEKADNTFAAESARNAVIRMRDEIYEALKNEK